MIRAEAEKNYKPGRGDATVPRKVIVCQKGINSMEKKPLLPPMFEGEPISEQIYRTVKGSIISGSMDSNSFFTEISAAETFNVSRTPAREALRRLEAEGFLQNIPRKGYRVFPIQDIDMLKIYDVAIALEPASARLAAQNRTEEQLDELREIVQIEERLFEKRKDFPKSSKLNCDFHLTVAKMAQNQYLYGMIESVQEKLLMHEAYNTSLSDYYAHREQWIFITHSGIFKAIELMDGETSEFLMRKHFQKSKSNWERRES